MSFGYMIPGLIIGIFSGLGLQILLGRKQQVVPWSVWYLVWILPFFTGGFYTYTAALTAGILLIHLTGILRRDRRLQFQLNSSSFACIAIVLGYCLVPLWAADKGMAVFGIVRYVPILILAVLLMQYTNEQRTQFLALLPICGTIMTVTAVLLWFLPSATELVCVNGRLSGFLQYPNTFAAFLLTGIAVLGAKEKRYPIDYFLAAILTAGIFLSGSRTGTFLLILFLIFLPAIHKRMSFLIPAALAAAGCLLLFVLAVSGKPFTILGRDIGSMFVRLLYYKDAIPVILQHPFGLGYMGYRALEATFQTSPYTVSFVHSGFLQLMLDIGWMPPLLLVFSVGKALRSVNTTLTQKTVLCLLVFHSLFDFNLQFFFFWAVLLLCLDWKTGNCFCICSRNLPAGMLSAVSLTLCIWMGAGDFCYQLGNPNLALKITPFHTDALNMAIQATADPEELDHLADRILDLNPTHSLAHSAKANAAFSRGDVMDMINYKEKAIQCAPYTIEEYCDYIEKLYIVTELYVQADDQKSAVFCLEKMLSIPEAIETVNAKTDPLAYRTGNSAQITLPDTYRSILNALQDANFAS